MGEKWSHYLEGVSEDRNDTQVDGDLLWRMRCSRMAILRPYTNMNPDTASTTACVDVEW